MLKLEVGTKTTSRRFLKDLKLFLISTATFLLEARHGSRVDTLTVGNSNRGSTFKSSGAEGMMTTGLSETVIRGAKPEMIPFEISNN